MFGDIKTRNKPMLLYRYSPNLMWTPTIWQTGISTNMARNARRRYSFRAQLFIWNSHKAP